MLSVPIWFLIFGNLLASKLEFNRKKVIWRSQFVRELEEVEGWDSLGTAALNDEVIFLFGIKQRNVDVLERRFWQVSNPKNDDYGRYMTNEQITKLIGAEGSLARSFLERLTNEIFAQSGYQFSSIETGTRCSLNVNQDWLSCSMRVRDAQRYFGVRKFNVFRKPGGVRKYVRTHHHLELPSAAAALIDYIGGASSRLPPHNQKLAIKETEFKQSANENFKHIGIYPTIIRERYNISKEVGQHPDNSQCTPQFLEQYYHERDLSVFWKLYGKGYYHRDDVDVVVGEVGDGMSGIEASLDTQYILSTGNNITTWFWYTAGRHEQQEPFLQWLIDLSNTEKPPLVNSASYSDVEASLDPDYIRRVNTEFMKAGVRGLTLLFASGDDGAGCKDNKRFEPQFPSSSPYITTIGGTAFIHPFGIGEEQGYDISGGGFSNVFQMPDYQAQHVAHYFETSDKEKLPPEEYYTKTGRGYPDLAAVSNHYWVVNNMVPVPGVLGTSASCPVIAGILAHVNDYRLRSDLPPLGFLNPLIYQNAEKLTDVTKGYNAGCDLSDYYDRGFYASEGWDPVTGLGNPNFPALLELAMEAALSKSARYPST